MQHKKHPGGACNPPFENIVFSSCLRALDSYECPHQTKGAQHYGCNHQGTGSLDVTLMNKPEEKKKNRANLVLIPRGATEESFIVYFL